MNMGNYSEYSEQLESGGKLIVNSSGWRIEYFFLGPDFRHNGQRVIVSSVDVYNYIEAYKSNYETYENLKNQIPSGGSFEMIGLCDMKIVVGGFRSGIHIAYTYNHLSGSCFPIEKREQLNQVIRDYEYCILRAEEINKLLYK